jgi:hypothetical protein
MGHVDIKELQFGNPSTAELIHDIIVIQPNAPHATFNYE